MTKLNKISFGNPLSQMKLHQELQEYNNARTDEELADFYHRTLNRYEGKRNMVCTFIMALIAQSVGKPLSKMPTEL